MSVLKCKRSVSRAEYVNTANQIYTETLNFISRLSARYGRLVGNKTSDLASDFLTHVECANKIYPSDRSRHELRKEHILEALGTLAALDIHLAHTYEVLMLNPQGCFTKGNGKSIPPKEAVTKIDNMAESLGSLIDTEGNLLRALQKSDEAAIRKKEAEENGINNMV